MNILSLNVKGALLKYLVTIIVGAEFLMPVTTGKHDDLARSRLAIRRHFVEVRLLRRRGS